MEGYHTIICSFTCPRLVEGELSQIWKLIGIENSEYFFSFTLHYKARFQSFPDLTISSQPFSLLPWKTVIWM